VEKGNIEAKSGRGLARRKNGCFPRSVKAGNSGLVQKELRGVKDGAYILKKGPVRHLSKSGSII